MYLNPQMFNNLVYFTGLIISIFTMIGIVVTLIFLYQCLEIKISSKKNKLRSKNGRAKKRK